MRITISNIAWDRKEEGEISKILQSFDISGIDVSLTKIWDVPTVVSDLQISQYRKHWSNLGIKIIAVQSLLFNHPELQIFQDKETRQKTFEYLIKIMQISQKLGAKVLIFGSPKNRSIREGTSFSQAWDVAIDFFGKLGEMASKHGVYFCIEPLPIKYGCNFINTASEGWELVKAVGSPNFRLHLDSGAMVLTGDDLRQSIEDSFDFLEHFHISEPDLLPIGTTGQVDYQLVALTLRGLNYQKWVSIEMKSLTHVNARQISKALDFVNSLFKPS